MDATQRSHTDWWQGGSLYQVYPRSFADGNGDGVGDLTGLIRGLDHIKKLGMTGLWLGPVFKSPMVDFGYDVSDYYSLDPTFGSMDEFHQLVTACQQRDLKIILDLVLSHTSDQHPWFQDSEAHPDGPYGDWYIWADGKEGGPPNNWLSVFGGSAWTFSETRQQYYLHNFLKQQPDLNFHNPAMRAELLRVVKYWLDQKVDGFRLDACNCYFHNPSLSDNPVSHGGHTHVQDETNPYFEQTHLFDKSQPQNKDFLMEFRQLVDQYPGRFLVGEIFCDREEETTRDYTMNGFPLHSAYNFSLLQNHRHEGSLREPIIKYHSISPSTAWAFSNHDVTRVVSRWPDRLHTAHRAQGYLTLLSGLPGMVFLYQGEELGLTEALLPMNARKDPFGDNMESSYPGRDGCRTPLPWDDRSPGMGFTAAQPWLPIPEDHQYLSIRRQEADSDSTLRLCQKLFQFRRSQECLKTGNIQFWRDDEKAVIYSRSHHQQSFLFAASFSDEFIEIEDIPRVEMLDGLCQRMQLREGGLVLEPGARGVLKFKDDL
jgi:alpha-glucosidase